LKRARHLGPVLCLTLASYAQVAVPGSERQEAPELSQERRNDLSPDDPGAQRETPLLARLAQCDLEESRRKTIGDAIIRRDYKAAERALLEEIDRRAPAPELLCVAAGVFFLDHDFRNSAIALKKADVLRPLSGFDRFSLSLSFIAWGHSNWARPELERLVNDDPSNPKYLYWLARVHYDERRYAESVVLLDKVVQLTPKEPKAYDNLGLSLEGSGEIERALKSYDQAARLNRASAKPSPWPPLNRGTLLSRLDRREEAEKSLLEALQYAPDLAQTHFRLGVLYDKEGHESEAIAELNKAASLDASYPDPLYALMRIYKRRGDQQLTQQFLARFNRLHSVQRGQQVP
jgi:tetratricopeptide (TPR) repeat protein